MLICSLLNKSLWHQLVPEALSRWVVVLKVLLFSHFLTKSTITIGLTCNSTSLHFGVTRLSFLPCIINAEDDYTLIMPHSDYADCHIISCAAPMSIYECFVIVTTISTNHIIWTIIFITIYPQCTFMASIKFSQFDLL